MNDKISPEVNHQTDEQEDFDPLAELARIVAGETENANIDQQDTESTPENEALIATNDMEAELMRELEQVKLDEASEQPEDLSIQIESINKLDASVEKIKDNSFAATTLENDMASFVVPAAPLESQSAEPIEEPVVIAETATETGDATNTDEETDTDDSGDFQNELIDALQIELEDTSSNESVNEQTLVPEPSAEIEIEEVTELDEENSFEEEMASIIDGSEEEPHLLIDTVGIDKDEDLGKAFLNEFESRVGYTSGVDEADSEPEPAPAVEEEISIDLEMDFEQAFSDELGLSSSEEEAQSNALPTMASIENNAPPQFEDEINLDPGHSGEIPEDTTQSAEKTGGFKYAVAAIIIALFAGAGVAVYGFVGDGKSLMASGTPVIEAVKSSYKSKPKDPGGKVVDNQDNATYAEVEGVGNQNSSQTDLVSNTEEPAVIDQSALDSSKDTDRLSNTEKSESAGATQNAVVKPRVVQIQTVKPDGTIVTSSPSSAAATLVEEQLKVASNQAKELATEVKTVATQVIEPLKPLDGAKTTNQVVAPTASPKEKPVIEAKPSAVAVPAKRPAKSVATQVANVSKPTTTTDNQPTVLPNVQPEVAQPVAVTAPVAPASSWVVQVSSSPSKQEAQSSYTRMARKYPVIQGRSTNIVSAQVNGRTYYRLRLNTASKSDASNLCSQLKSSGGDCFITR